MTDSDVDTLAHLLDDLRRELGSAVDDLERSRAAHRRVESLLLAVLEHVPVPVVVVDGELRLQAVSAAAEQAWGAQLDAPLAGLGDRLGGIAGACQEALEAGRVAGDGLPEGLAAAVIDEPGTHARYVVVWPTSSSAAVTGHAPGRGSMP